MKRRLAIFSPISLVFTLVLLVGLAFAILQFGGMGFSPGPVSAKAQDGVDLKGFHSHADFEKNCGLCHQPLNADQATLCIACHADIGQQRAAQTGLHGRLDPAVQCGTCHAEHKGRDFDATASALASFDHNQTRFRLTGKHLTTACADCHKNNQYQLASVDCVQCHQEPPSHAGMFGQDCAQCHSTDAWKPARVNGKLFDHSQVSFVLDRHQKDAAGQPMLCAACHSPGSSMTPFNAQTCVSCHTQIKADFMTQHLQKYGPDCLQCHDGKDRMMPFNHANFFVLDGKHAQLDCAQCHANQKFKGTPTACASCHQEPKVHAGFFGLNCQDCHTSDAWRPAPLRVHTFPLDHGGKGEVACQTCHPNSYTEYTCYTCHTGSASQVDHPQDEIKASHTRAGIALADLPKCDACHALGTVDKTRKKP